MYFNLVIAVQYTNLFYKIFYKIYKTFVNNRDITITVAKYVSYFIKISIKIIE